MEVDLRQDGENLIVRLTGELDHHSATRLRRTIDRRLDKGEVRNLILNFQQVSFMDSSGVGVILGRYRRVKGRGGKMALCLIPAGILKVLEISGVPKIIPFMESEKQALEAVSQW
ncbi:MAG: anti-sigma F factor antagonist [Firmicutes bacterium]|nr:anti-sigma F factor antagonist [Bacillota bacterium]